MMFYLRKIDVFRGGGELVGAMLGFCWLSAGCLDAFWKLEAMRLDTMREISAQEIGRAHV